MTMPEARTFSLDVKKVAVARLELGESADVIAAELGIHRITPYKWRRAQRAGRLDKEPGTRRLPPELAAAIPLSAQAHVEKALQALAEVIANGESEASRIAAAKVILARAQARPGKAGETANAATPITRIERVIIRPRDQPTD